MSRTLKFASAGLVAAAVVTSSVWFLGHFAVDASFIFAVAFAAGYLALFTLIRILGPSSPNPPLATQLRFHAPFGIAVLLLAEVTVYVCTELLGVGDLRTINTVVLLAVVCWVALGWRVVGGDARRSPSGSTNAAKHE